VSTICYDVITIPGEELPMTQVGVRAVRARLSAFLRRVAGGEWIVITDRGRPVALMSPPPGGPEDLRVRALVQEGFVRWAGGKPQGVRHPVRVRGRSVAEAVIEDRR
jgi:antitoxin (DNA-binding transcriptional repressor) of toxin-antitoxin stability system